jgi:4-aminobutyrate aminotransferase
MTLHPIVERARRHLTPALVIDWPLAVVRAEGPYIYDADGKAYLDFASGTAVANVGHRPPRVLEALRRQMDRLIHAGCTYYFEALAELGERLAQVMPGDIDTFFFSNSGAEAVEGAIKLAKYVTGRPAVIAFEGAFHGRTLACISLTTSAVKFRRRYAPLLPEVYHVPFPNPYRFEGTPDECVQATIDALYRLFETRVPPEAVAAILVEPVQGEGGYVVPPLSFLRELRRVCDEHGILLVLDEVQTGFGRTLRWFACEHSGIVPDVMAVAKGIASGLPLSAVCAPRRIMEQWSPGAHGTTFGGSPLACAAAIATIDTIREDRLLEKGQALQPGMMEGLRRLQEKYECLGDVRGLGYMVGLEFVRDRRSKRPWGELVRRVLENALADGLLLISCGRYGNVIRWIPPLVVEPEHIERAIQVLDRAIERALREIGGP